MNLDDLIIYYKEKYVKKGKLIHHYTVEYLEYLKAIEQQREKILKEAFERRGTFL